MIRVKRKAATAKVTAALNKRCKKLGLTELEAALWYYENIAPDHLNPLPAKPDNAPTFEAYRHDDVKALLGSMFENHCAYCESFYDHVTPMDVEHYRPKGAVIEDDGTKSTPGYYWLAAVWENLLPSCPGCNRSRRQGQAEPEGLPYEATSGKANLFPLAAGCARAKAKGLDKHEDAMLLNPCDNDPEPHLVFRADGFVEPRPGAVEQEKPRGMATIEVCGLDRATLVEERRKAAAQLRKCMIEVLQWDGAIRMCPAVQQFQDNLTRAKDALSQAASEVDYRALARELVGLFNRVRDAVSAYFLAETAWRTSQSEADEAMLTGRAGDLIELHRNAGLHQRFVYELYAVAQVPVDQLPPPPAP